MPGPSPTDQSPHSPSTRRRVSVAATLALAVLIVQTGAVAAADPASPRPKLPAVRPGTPIVVTYRDAASFRGGADGTGAATQTDSLAKLRTRTFRAAPGQDRKALRELAAARGVVAIEYDVTVKSTATPNDVLWAGNLRWAHDAVKLRSAWDTTKGSRSTIIAILDSGLQRTHPEFADRTLPGHDFVEGDRTVDDGRGHGTMSAGVAGARGNNSIGVAGACWSCRILPVKVLDTGGRGYGSAVNRGIVWAVDRGADVINMSFGGFKPTSSMKAAIDYARSRGVVIVASAGNDGSTARFYPAAFPGVIAVAASDAAHRPYSWSNRGGWVHLTAPGCLPTTKTGSRYGMFCGTSASAPLVAGIVGLMRSVDPKASPSRIESMLFRTASPKPHVRHGLVNAAAAVAGMRAVGAHVEKDGRVIIEAERTIARVSRGGTSWTNAKRARGFVGIGYVRAGPDSGRKSGSGFPTRAAEMRYAVKFTKTGTYDVWVRAWAPNRAGDTVHVGVNGKVVNSAKRIWAKKLRTWAWTRATRSGSIARIRVTSPGVHIINIWVHEDGMRIDRLMLSSRGKAPRGVGPGESARTPVTLR